MLPLKRISWGKQPQPEVAKKVLRVNFEPECNCVKEYETLLNSLYGLQFTNDGAVRPIFTFGIMSKGEDTILYVTVPEEYETIFKKKYAAVDPYIQFEEIEDPLLELASAEGFIEGYELKMVHQDPEKTLKGVGGSDAYSRFMGNMLNAMNNYDNEDISLYEVAIQPLNSNKVKSSLLSRGLATTAKLGIEGIRWGLHNLVLDENVDKENKKQKENKKPDILSRLENLLKFNTNIRVVSTSTNHVSALNNIKGMAAVFSDLSSSNSLVPVSIGKDDIVNRKLTNNNRLSTLEIVQFLHLPDKTVNTENMGVSNCKKVYDRDVPQEGVNFGMTGHNFDIPCCFPAIPVSTETFKSCYADIHKLIDNFAKPRLFLGQQGTGKSEAIINYVIACIKLGIGVIVVDPKNDTQQRLIESIPHEFLHNLDYINYGDTVYPPGMNLFRKRSQGDDPTENSLIVTSFISLMKKEYSKWGFHIQRILQNTAEAILLMQISTMHEFELMLVDRKYREWVIETMKTMLNDPEKKGKSHIKKLVRYWDEFNARKDEIIARDIEPVMNQIGPFLSNRVIKSIVSQNNSFDFRKAADQGRIVIINLPEGVLGENTRLLSSMINKAIWIDIQSRASVDISERYPVAWIIDEAHEIVDDEFISVLTKARAYRLGLTLVTQGLTNFGMRKMDEIKTLIQTNCKNKVVFRVGYQDGREIGEEFSPLTTNDVQNCPDYHFYAKILLPDGTVSKPFFGRAPMPAKKVRNFDDFAESHRSGMLTVDQIEDELEDRMDYIDVMKTLITM